LIRRAHLTTLAPLRGTCAAGRSQRMNAQPARTSPLAVISLIFGILCWAGLPLIGAIVAVVCGHAARGEIRRAPAGMIEGDGMALAGLILGWVHLLLVFLCVFVLFTFLGGLAFFAHLAH
jgi:hypothetical protein